MKPGGHAQQIESSHSPSKHERIKLMQRAPKVATGGSRHVSAYSLPVLKNSDGSSVAILSSRKSSNSNSNSSKIKVQDETGTKSNTANYIAKIKLR